jgi:hypothetical protein
MLTPGVGYPSLGNTLPGLRHLLMVEQWVMPGGGLPSGSVHGAVGNSSDVQDRPVPFLRKGVIDTRAWGVPKASA